MTKVKVIFFLFTLVLASWACTERIDIKTDNNIPKLVITGLLTTEPGVHKIYVSRSVQYLGNEPIKYYLNATVKLNDAVLPVDSSLNAYVTDQKFYGEPGKTYKLEVWVDFNEDGELEYYTSSATMPNIVNLDKIYLGSMSATNPLGPPWMLFYAFQDPIGPNYYGADLYINSFRYSWTLTNYSVNDFNYPSDDGRYINYPAYYIDKEIKFRNSNDEKLILKPGDTLTLKLNCLTKDYFDFIKAAQQEIDGGGNPLFAGPPANVPGNISNGALGIFGAYTISSKQIYLPTTPTFQ